MKEYIIKLAPKLKNEIKIEMIAIIGATSMLFLIAEIITWLVFLLTRRRKLTYHQ